MPWQQSYMCLKYFTTAEFPLKKFPSTSQTQSSCGGVFVMLVFSFTPFSDPFAAIGLWDSETLCPFVTWKILASVCQTDNFHTAPDLKMSQLYFPFLFVSFNILCRSHWWKIRDLLLNSATAWSRYNFSYVSLVWPGNQMWTVNGLWSPLKYFQDE